MSALILPASSAYAHAELAWAIFIPKIERKIFIKEYAYIRVSSKDQNQSRQIDAMASRGIPQGCIFTEKQSGKDTNRPILQSLMNTVQEGDVIVVESISRFARNTKDLLSLVEKLTKKGVEFVSLKEHIDTTTPAGRFTLTVFGAISELEREHILQRQAEGIAAAKARGKHLGRPIKTPPSNFAGGNRRSQGKGETSRQTDKNAP